MKPEMRIECELKMGVEHYLKKKIIFLFFLSNFSSKLANSLTQIVHLTYNRFRSRSLTWVITWEMKCVSFFLLHFQVLIVLHSTFCSSPKNLSYFFLKSNFYINEPSEIL